MAKPTGLPDEVRAIFEERKGRSLGHHQVFALMGVTVVDKTKERNGVRNVLSWLVGFGYLAKTDVRATAAYRYSGQGMTSTSHVWRRAIRPSRWPPSALHGSEHYRAIRAAAWAWTTAEVGARDSY